MGTQAVRRVAPLGAGVAVLAVLGGTAYLVQAAGGGPGEPRPRPLRLSSYVSTAEPAGAGRTAGRFVLAGELPGRGDAPDHARVQRFVTAPTEASVRRLAAALGLAGSPRTVANARVVTHGLAALRVAEGPGNAWQFARQDAGPCLDAVTVTPGSANGSGCAVAAAPAYVGTTPAAPPGRPVTARAALAVARPVLQAVGLDPGRARTQDLRPFVMVRVDPTVGGLPTFGAATTVTVDAAGIRSAQGWLAGTLPGDAYPLVSAREAFDRLDRLPVPMTATPTAQCPAIGAGAVAPWPACGGPVTVVGATLGLSLQWEGDRPLLVPSWLFAVKGSDQPLAQVAVDPAYVQAPATPPVPSTVPTTEPGTGPGLGGGVPPDAPTAEPTVASRFGTVARGAESHTLVVTFTGGVAMCVRYQVLAKESADRVVLSLDEQRATRGPCVALAQVYERTVRLRAPLGDRSVVDAASGRVLPVRR